MVLALDGDLEHWVCRFLLVGRAVGVGFNTSTFVCILKCWTQRGVRRSSWFMEGTGASAALRLPFRLSPLRLSATP
jgi:hypothetical protein